MAPYIRKGSLGRFSHCLSEGACEYKLFPTLHFCRLYKYYITACLGPCKSCGNANPVLYLCNIKKKFSRTKEPFNNFRGDFLLQRFLLCYILCYFASICRKIAKDIAQEKPLKEKITPEIVEGFLGPRKFFLDVAEVKDRIGVATGLAWTEAGGDIIFVEAAKMKGRKELILTGSLGEVMRESAQAALSYIRSHVKELNIPENFYDKFDIHVHVPSGAIPKDGPSA